MELIDKEFIPKDFREKEADIIYKLKIKDSEIIFYVLIENQTKVDFTMPLRLLIYMTELLKRLFLDVTKKERERKTFKLPVIVPIVLYSGKNEWTAVKSFKEYLSGYELFEENTIDFEYILLNINRYTDEELIKIGNLVSSIFMLDKKKNTDYNFIKKVEKLSKILLRLSTDDKIDLATWMKEVLIVKVSEENKTYISEATNALLKGDVESMTSGLGIMIDREKKESADKMANKIAKNMIKKGYVDGDISDMTGLDKQEILEIREKLRLEKI